MKIQAVNQNLIVQKSRNAVRKVFKGSVGDENSNEQKDLLFQYRKYNAQAFCFTAGLVSIGLAVLWFLYRARKG